MADIEVPVFIVGGSLVGLSTAMLLGYHGVRSLAVEYHRSTAVHPRAAQTSQRTMEIFRQVGLEQIVRRNSEKQFVQDGGVVAVETLVGGTIAHPDHGSAAHNSQPVTVREYGRTALIQRKI